MGFMTEPSAFCSLLFAKFVFMNGDVDDLDVTHISIVQHCRVELTGFRGSAFWSGWCRFPVGG